VLEAVGLTSDRIGQIGIGAIIAVVVIGVVLSFLISALIMRVVILVAVVVLGGYIWQQRSAIENRVKQCHLEMTFLGLKVTAPADVVAECKKVAAQAKAKKVTH
jgi:hypothetical protein